MATQMQANLDLVTLGLGAEIFAVPVACVVEIVAMRELFSVPDAPPFLAGLTELRGKAVPVIDLRRKLSMPPAVMTHHTRIIVLETEVDQQSLMVGLIADRVIEVISLAADQIGPPPQYGGTWRSNYIAGIARHGPSFVIIFDMAELLSSDDIQHISPRADAPIAEICAA